MDGYNGWKNRATWNVSLWVNNDEGLYRMAVDYVRSARKNRQRISWDRFVVYACLAGSKTPDGYAYASRDLSRRELSGMLREIE